jgi:hypothetical protein
VLDQRRRRHPRTGRPTTKLALASLFDGLKPCRIAIEACGRQGGIAVKVINHLGDEVMKVYRVE